MLPDDRQNIATLIDEPLVSLGQATKLPVMPRRRKNKKPNISTVWRWWKTGIKGIRLETIVCGGVRCTSEAAIRRFFERLTAAADGDPAPVRSTAEKRRAVRDAERVLDAAKI